MVSVKIRGIYSTALTELFLNNQFTITHPSPSLRERFPEVNFLTVDPDIIIEDMMDGEGIFFHSKSRLSEISKNPINPVNFPELVTIKCAYSVDAIYRAKVVRNNPDKRISYVKLKPPQEGDEKNFFDAILDGVFYPGKYLNVQIKNPESGNQLPRVTTNLTFSGKNIVFVLKNPKKVLISKKIADKDRRHDLFNLGKSLDMGDWGVILRTEAQYETNEDILKEYDELKGTVEKLVNAVKDQRDVGITNQRYFSTIYQFTQPVKAKLDETRNKIIPTLTNHHGYKASGRGASNFGEIIDFAEFMVYNEPDSKAKVEHSLQQYFFSAFAQGVTINIEHQKLSGQKIMLTPGTVEKIEFLPENSVKVVVKRKFRASHGTYDGIEAQKQEGDYAIAEYISGSETIQTKYFRESGDIIGTYINLNTPVEFVENGVYYVDLELDVVEDATGTRKIIDEQELEKYIQAGVIEKAFGTRILKRAQDIQKEKAWFF